MTVLETGKPGPFHRLLDSLFRWTKALNYSGAEYTFDRIAGSEQEVWGRNAHPVVAHRLDGRPMAP